MIPKVVYFTHENINEKNKFSEIITFNKQKNPELKFIFFDDKKRRIFINKYYPEFYKFYNCIHYDYGAMKADIFRVLILYHYGGIYIDIKTKIINIYDIIKNKPFCCGTYDEKIMHFYNKLIGFEISNFFISSEKKGNIIKLIKNEMYKRLNYFGNIPLSFKYNFLPGTNVTGMTAVYFHTGPGLFNDVVTKFKNDITIIKNKKNLIYDQGSTFTYRLLNFKKQYKNRYHISKNNIFLCDNLNKNLVNIKSHNSKNFINKILFLLICFFILNL